MLNSLTNRILRKCIELFESEVRFLMDMKKRKIPPLGGILIPCSSLLLNRRHLLTMLKASDRADIYQVTMHNICQSNTTLEARMPLQSVQLTIPTRRRRCFGESCRALVEFGWPYISSARLLCKNLIRILHFNWLATALCGSFHDGAFATRVTGYIFTMTETETFRPPLLPSI